MTQPAETPSFEQTQRMTSPWLRAGALLMVALAWGTFGSWLVTGDAPGENPPPVAAQVVLLAIFGVGMPWMMWSLRLTSRVYSDRLVVVLWPIWRRTVPLAAIESATPVTYRPILEFLGWGVRWSPVRGWAITLCGNRGVELLLEGNRHLLVGSAEPEELVEAIARER